MREGRGTMEVAAEQIARFEQYVRFVSCDPEQNRQRFYLLCWQRSLHGECILVSTWGRLGTLGRSRVIRFPERLPVETSLQRLIRRRLRRGYQIIEWC